MIKITGSGWATITLNGKEICEASYDTDIANDFLEGFINLLKDKNCNQVVIKMDLEPDICWLVLCGGNSELKSYYKITDGYDSTGKPRVVERVDLGNIDCVKMAKELIEDIESDLDNWACFQFYKLGKTEEEVKQNELNNKNRLLKKIEKLKDIIYSAE